MANALEFILRLQDMLSPGMRQAASISQTAAGRIQSQFTSIATGGNRMNASVSELRARLEAVNRVRFGTTLQREFDVATRAANRLERQIQTLEGRGGNHGLGGKIGGLMAGFGAYGIGKMALGGAAEREQQNISFEVMTGNKDVGQKMVKDLVNMGAQTPYESADLIKNAQTLKAFGIENEKVLPILKTIGDIGGGSAEKLGSLSLAFAQVSSAGKLSGQDLLQMVNAGFNPLQQMVKDKVFPSMMDARKAMEKGAIGANMVEAAFKSATGPGGQFHNMMQRQSQTLSGRWSTFMDNAKNKLLGFGEALMPLAGKLLDFGSALMEGAPWAIGLASAIGLVTLSLTWASIQTGIFNAVTRSAAFFTGIWTGVQAVFNATLWANPITWVVMGIIALIAIIGYVVYVTDGWGKQWDQLIKFFKFSWASFKDYFTLMWLNVQDSFLSGIELIKTAWYKLKSLWDEEGAAAGLASIDAKQNARAAEIAKQKGVLQSDLDNAKAALTWELHSNGKGLDTMTADIKKKLGFANPAKSVDPTSANLAGSKLDYGLGAGGDGNGKSGAKSKADGINQGGQKSVVINIGKQIETLTQNIVGGSKEAAESIANSVREEMTRVFYSLNGN